MSVRRMLVSLWDGGGVVPPVLHVVKRLVDRGHYVVVQGDPTIGPEADAAGAVFTPWKRAPHRTTRDRDADILRDYAAQGPSELFRMSEAYFYRTGEDWMADLLEAIDTHHVDLVLGECLLPWPPLAAEVRGLPSGMLHTMPYHVPTPGMAPAGAALLPVPRWLAPVRDGLLRRAIEWVFDRYLGHVNRVRGQFGVAPVRHTFDQLRGATAQIVLGSRMFDFDGIGAPPNVVWAGPQLADPAWCAPWTPPWSAADPRPIVLVALSSTYQAQIPLLQRLVDALSALPVRGLVTTGPTVRDGEVHGAENVWVVPSAPHRPILNEAALLVMHAGHGVTMKGLAAGVPTVCVPMGRDQGDNAARVVALGAGWKASPGASTPRLRRTIERALASSELRQGAHRAASRFAERAGEVDVIDSIEALGTARAGSPRQPAAQPAHPAARG